MSCDRPTYHRKIVLIYHKSTVICATERVSRLLDHHQPFVRNYYLSYCSRPKKFIEKLSRNSWTSLNIFRMTRTKRAYAIEKLEWRMLKANAFELSRLDNRLNNFEVQYDDSNITRAVNFLRPSFVARSGALEWDL